MTDTLEAQARELLDLLGESDRVPELLPQVLRWARRLVAASRAGAFCKAASTGSDGATSVTAIAKVCVLVSVPSVAAPVTL